MLSLLAIGLLIAGLLAFSTRYLLFRRLFQLALQPPSYRLAPPHQAPLSQTQLWQPAQTQLQALGFRPLGPCHIQPLIYRDRQSDWELLMHHPASGSFAHIGLRHPIEPQAPTKVNFYSFCPAPPSAHSSTPSPDHSPDSLPDGLPGNIPDDILVLTLNGEAHGLIGQLPHSHLRDPYSPDLAHQWQVHQQQLHSLGCTPRSLSPSAYIQRLTQRLHHYFDQLQRQGNIIPVPQPSSPSPGPFPGPFPGPGPFFQLSLSQALRTTWQIDRGSRAAAALARAYHQQTSTAEPLPISLEVESFERMQHIERGALRRPSGERWIFWISLLLFMVSFRHLFDGPGLLLFSAAIALHEGGHHWAMRSLGYQDTSIFFLPFLGAAATGHKAHARLWEKVLVLLAGPMPGLGLGMVAHSLSLAHPESAIQPLLHQASSIFIGLNLFNLLPVYPLDGGKVAHLLFLSGHPRLEVSCKILAALFLASLGFLSPVLFLVAIPVALSIPQGYRNARLLKHLRHEPAAQPYLTQIIQQLQALGYGKLPFAQRYQLTKALWEQQGESNSPWPLRLCLSGLYLFCLISAPAGIALTQGLAPGSRLAQSLDNPVQSQAQPTFPSRLP